MTLRFLSILILSLSLLIGKNSFAQNNMNKKSVDDHGGDIKLDTHYHVVNPLPVPLQKYLAHVQNNHHALKFIATRNQIALEGVNNAKLGIRPQITAQGYLGRTRTDTQNELFNTDAKYNEISISQPLYTGGRVSSEIDAAMSELSESKALTNNEINQFLFDASDAYTSFYKSKYLVKLGHETADNAEKRVKSVKAEMASGERSITDLAIAESRFAQSQAELSNAMSEFDSAKAKFLYFMGTDVPADIATNAQNPLDIKLDFIPPEPVMLYQLNPRILEANAGVNTAAAAIEQAKAQYAPSVNLDGRAAYNDRRDEIGREIKSDDYSVLARYNIPLYSRGMEYSAGRKAALQEERAKNRLVSLSGDVVSEYKSNILKYQAADSVVTAYQTALKSAIKAAKAAEQEYQYGFRSITDLSDADKDVSKAKSDLITAKTQRLTALLSVLKDIDGLRIR